MQALTGPLKQFHEACSWFVRSKELRLLVVRVSGQLRTSALELLPKYEFHADNRHFWVVFEDEAVDFERGWQARTNRLLQHWSQRQQAYDNDGQTLDPLSEDAKLELSSVLTDSDRRHLNSRAGDSPETLRKFLATAYAACERVPSPAEGLLLALAPAQIEDGAVFEAELSVLMDLTPLAQCRWILLLDEDMPVPSSLLKRLGANAQVAHCLVSKSALHRDLQNMLNGPVQPGGHPGANGLGARPRNVVPPPRRDDPPPIDPALEEKVLNEAGIDPEVLRQMPRLRQQVLGAGLAMSQQDGAQALRLQSEACALAEEIGLSEIHAICLIALASYQSGLGFRREAFSTLEEAVLKSKAYGLPRLESQAHLARGLLYVLDKANVEAEQAYVAAAEVAEQAQEPAMSIEAWRMAGQLVADTGATTRALQHFNQAIRVTEGVSTVDASGSSAAEAARQMAQLYLKQGGHAQARSLHALADRIEAGEVGQSDHPAHEAVAGTDGIGADGGSV